MARLPQPGSDSGKWGDILNDYLSQSHNSDGTLKDDSVGAAQLQQSAVTSAAIADNAVTSGALAPNSVTTATIASGAVQTAQLAPGVVTADKIDPNAQIAKAQLADEVQTSLGRADGAMTQAVADARYAPVSALSAGVVTPAQAALRAAVNADHAAAFARIQRLFSPPPNGLFLAVDHSGGYTFLIGLGSGRFAAFFLPRQAQSLNGVTYTCNCLNGCAIQLAMLSQDDTSATFGGSGTWTAQPTAYIDGTTPGTSGVVYAPKPITVSMSAGSAAVTVTSGTVSSSDSGRRISIPGAGASGAAYETTIGTVTDSTHFAVGTAAQTTVSGSAATIFPTYRYNSTSGGTVTWVSPANSVALAIGTVTAQNGGLAKVTVSGSSAGAVAANLLPTAQQVVDSGRYPNTILTATGGSLSPTDRVLDCYAGQANTFLGVKRAIAEGLTTDTYTVTVTATGYQPTGGTGARTYIDRFAYGLATTSPTSAGAEMYSAYDLSPGFASAWEYAFECKPSTGSTWTWVGQTAHQLEDQQSLTVTVDEGLSASPSAGQTIAVRSALLSRTTKLYHPDSGAGLSSSPMALGQVDYRLDRNGLSVTPTLTFSISTDIRTAYSMMPLVGTSGTPAKIDRAALEASADLLVMTGSGSRLGTTRSAFGWAWDSTGKVGAAMYIPDFFGFTDGYSATLDGTQVEDRGGTAPTTKFYSPWVGVNRPRTVPVGWTKTWTTRYMVGVFLDANASLSV
ncbi:hypothetical protein [Gordonia aichiensis]|uniref:Uncharacterized protein n=1 Tax=Gordonia aichiensis NBRC 108223 TaxID=1220583 RepID=L7KQX1_9ACTN|nr:hypothetical protein [Gordonia aichiensis]GAC50989.1 hypothetical protein GOACH_36_00110 [Gordonia aichiensis NBRC 108223]